MTWALIPPVAKAGQQFFNRVKFSFADDSTNLSGIGNTQQGIRIKQYEVGPLARVDRADVVFNAEKLCGPDGRRGFPGLSK